MNEKLITDANQFTKEQKLWLLAVAIGGAMSKGDIGRVMEAAGYLNDIVTKEDCIKAREMTKDLQPSQEQEPPDLSDPGIITSFPV